MESILMFLHNPDIYLPPATGTFLCPVKVARYRSAVWKMGYVWLSKRLHRLALRRSGRIPMFGRYDDIWIQCMVTPRGPSQRLKVGSSGHGSDCEMLSCRDSEHYAESNSSNISDFVSGITTSDSPFKIVSYSFYLVALLVTGRSRCFWKSSDIFTASLIY